LYSNHLILGDLTYHMDRLNYFNPYQSKDAHNEDQLTRAYLTLLRHSYHAFATFYEYCVYNHQLDAAKEEHRIPLFDLLGMGWELSTQKGNPLIETEWLLSVLITDTHLKDNYSALEKSDRNARYDGIITFGNKLTLIIEVKPRFNNVWYGQLRPSKQNLADETIIYSAPSILEWKQIINHLNKLLSTKTLSGFEKTMIEDFLAFVDENFKYLNPYDNLQLCKGNHELIYRRINNILKSLVNDESLVQYHQGWGFYIQTPYNEIRKIGLIFHYDSQQHNWSIKLSLYFGASQTQARSFYQKSISFDNEKFTEWDVHGNFHVSFVTSNLVWLPVKAKPTDYINYWKNNQSKIRQQSRENVPAYLEKLVNDNIVKIGKYEREALDKRFYHSKMQTLNMVPELGMLFEIKSDEAEKLDKDGLLVSLLMDKIKDGLSLIGKNGKEFLKTL
jgi:hypothetical protein